MSVMDAEPKIPNGDTGKGLRVIGWILVLWTGASMIWIPTRLWWSDYMPIVNGLTLVAGLFFLSLGYYVSRHSPSATAVAERTHDLMANHEGHQNDEHATGNGPGEAPNTAA